MSLTNSQIEFFEMVEQSSCSEVVLPYFDFERRKVRLKDVTDTIGQLSHGQQIMVKFFVAVWLHKDPLGFDLLEAASTLDAGNKEIIADWLMTPLWP
ncbi:MAG: hypothetical protein GW898_10340 [Thiomicrospira sp.]|nr:hypothetical protein [Thiomicrospira sp.]NCN66301.1 hypothetical protein [Thiomicrospira sp.]NCO14754.1 hypothetical protein [Thiomicrospira sp.]NCO82351.1 hypothetical protein [Thiomicrospira sp.]OIP95182.1 MAG: hypothetical protein AUK56_06505 [Thiomicrospira sp. CG2_30_44_34]